MAAALVLLAVLFAFVSPMFDVPDSALRAYRAALAMMTILISAAFVACACLDLRAHAVVRGEFHPDALDPDPLDLSCALRC